MSGTLERIGARLDVLIRQGVDTGFLTFSASDGYDLTGWAWEGGAYLVTDRSSVAPWVFDTSAADQGIVTFSVGHTAMASMATNDADTPAKYAHWVTAISPDGERIPVLYGDFRVIWGANV